MVSAQRRTILMLGAAAVLAGCGEGAETAQASEQDDYALGAESAPVTLIEYASTTCSACAAFHNSAWAQIKANYIDTGKVRFILREYPTAPAEVAVAGFQVARCNNASPEDYFSRLSVLFEQQRAIFASGSMEGVRLKFIEIGAAANLSEDQVMQCITDEAGAARIRRTVEAARSVPVNGTPTFVINGRKHDGPITYESVSQALDAAASGS